MIHHSPLKYFVGIISLVYALLLHDGPPRHSSVPPFLPSYILSITTAAIKAINNSAILALIVVQVSLIFVILPFNFIAVLFIRIVLVLKAYLLNYVIF